MHLGKRYESLSPAKFHLESLDEARCHPLAVTPAGFEPSNMKKPGSTDLQSKSGRTKCGPERSEG